MTFRRLPAIGLVIILLMVASCGQEQISERDVLITLDSLEQKFEWLEYQLSLEYWDLYTKGEADSLDFYEGLRRKLVSDKKTLQKLQMGKNLLSNEEDERRRQILLAGMLYGLVEADLDIATLRDSITSLSMNTKAEFEGQERTGTYLARIMRNDPNRRRRESAFRAFTTFGEEMGSGLEQLFRLRNQAAKKLGFNSFLALVFNHAGLKPQEYRSYLDRLEALSEKPYLDILDRTSAKLNVDQLEYWDIWFPYADINQTVDKYFPAGSQMDYVKQSLKAMGFNLDKLPIYFDLEEREGKAQFTFSIPVKPPHDVRVLTNVTDGFYSTKLLLHEIGHALHFTHITQDRELFARSVEGAWAEGMAYTIASILGEKDWLVKYAKMPPQLVDSYMTSLEEQEIIALRRRLLILDFEFEAYMNPNRDINKLYWDMFVKYMRVPRHDESKYWAAITHYAYIPVYMQNYMYAELIAAQTVATLRDNYGSVVDNPDVSAFLIQNYYRFGGRYDWHEMLERGTGSELDPKYLIEELGL